MDTESKIRVSYTTEFVVVTGYVVLFCILIFACIGFFYIKWYQSVPKPPATNEFAEALPPITPTPHITSDHQFDPSSILFEERFNNNDNRWLGGDDTKERLLGGQLFFQSSDDGDYAIISCEFCPYLKTPFFFEASLSTDKVTDEEYGIVFNHSYTLDNFYLFMINPESMKYFLFHHSPESWTLRASGTSAQIRPYPERTTLGVYVNIDSLELYINRVIVDSYTESGSAFYPGFLGMYTNDSWFGVNVDDITVYEIGE